MRCIVACCAFPYRMFATIINDCRDQNAMGRQATRLASLLECPVVPIGVENDLEAAGMLVDALDASEGREGVVLVNVAPRQSNGKKRNEGSVGYTAETKERRENGSPFGYFYYQETLVVTSVDGLTPSLARKLGITDHIALLDIPAALTMLTEIGDISPATAERIKQTQFRSFEFLPRVARRLLHAKDFPTAEYIVEKADLPATAWYVDIFGNVKTTLLAREAKYAPGSKVQTDVGELTFVARLKDVADNTPALIVGSSGINEDRFCEIVIQGENAARKLGINVGSVIF